jgi:hypothetical protein
MGIFRNPPQPIQAIKLPPLLLLNLPTVTTQAVTAIGASYCTGNGNITALGGANCTTRGFCYLEGAAGNPTILDSIVSEDGDFGTGVYTKSITGLSPVTAYRVRAFVINPAGISYGSTVDVTTEFPGAPSITTQEATDMAGTSCTGNGNITSVGVSSATRRGFCYMAASYGDPSVDDSVVFEDGDFSTGAYTLGITGLTPGTAYRIRSYAINSIGTSYGNTVTAVTPAVAPTITTQAATNVLDIIATGNGTITSTGGANCSRRGFCWMAGTSGDPNIDDDNTVYEDDDFGAGTYSLTITGLTSEVGYRVRAYAINSAGTSYGTTVQITTGVTVVVPTVTTQAATEVEQISATGNGTISDTGGANATRRGFCWMTGVAGDPNITDNNIVYDDGDFDTGAYTKIITGLYPGTAYRVRAYATNNAGTNYGSTVQITTPVGLPVITTQAASAIAGTSCTGNGTIVSTGGANATRRGFCYMIGTTGDPTTADSTAYDNGDFGAIAYTKIITGLLPGTGYRIRAYAINSAGTSYGITVQVTTLAILSTVTTQAATNILHNSCLGNGTIVDTGGASAMRRGFCFIAGTAGDPTTSNNVVYEDGSFAAGVYTKTIIGLTPATGYRVRAYVVTSAGTSYGTTVQINTLAAPVIPTVTTQAGSSVSYDNFLGNGNITNIGNINCTRRGFCYLQGTSGTPTITDSIIYEDGSFGTGAFALLISALSSNTGYRVRAFAVNSAGVGYGTVVQVTTLSVVLPTVTTQAASSVASTSCIGNGNITSTGGANATRRGFCYKQGTVGNPTIADSIVYDDGSFGTGAFTKSITGLNYSTNYRVRSFVTNSAGTSYGTTVQVTTLTNANFIAEKNKRADGSKPINLLTFGFATPVYLSDRDITPAGGSAYLGLVKTWGFIDTSIAQTPGSGILGVIQTADLQLTIINSQSPRFSDNFTTVDPPENVTVSLSQWFAPLQYSEAEVIFKGTIFGQPHYDEYTCTLTIRGIFEKYNRKIGEDKIITAALYPDADPDDIGKMENIGYGTLIDVPCHALKAGTIDTLTADLTAAATSFYVSGDAVADYPSGTVIIQIDDEKISGTYSQTTHQFTSCTRGYNSTTIVAHDKGAQVMEILNEYIYEAFGHPIKTISAVRVDGVVPPTGFTVYTGQTGSILAGYEGKAVIKFTAPASIKKAVQLVTDQGSHQHGTTTMAAAQGVLSLTNNYIDLTKTSIVCPIGSSNYPAGAPLYMRLVARFASSVAAGGSYINAYLNYWFAGAGGYSYQLFLSGNPVAQNRYVASSWYNVSNYNWSQILGGSLNVVKSSGGTYTGDQLLFADVSIELQYVPFASPATGVTVSGNTTAETVFGKLITCDAQGYQDDAIGTYTGTPNALIEQPDHVFRHIWAVLLGAPAGDIDDVSFLAAGVFYAANTYKFAKLINEPIQASDLFMRLALQCRSRFTVTAAGKAKLFVRQLGQASTHAIIKNEIKKDSMSIDRSPTTEIINLLNINYGLDLTKSMTDPKSYNSALTFTDTTSVSRYGTKNWTGQADLFCFDAVRLAAMVTDVGNYLLAYHCRARKMPHFGVFLDNMEIAPADIIDVTHPLDAMTNFIVEVQKITHHIGSTKQNDWLEIFTVENGV